MSTIYSPPDPFPARVPLVPGIPPADLAFVADALLVLCAGEREGAYTDNAMRAKSRSDRRHFPRLAAALQRVAPDPLARREVDDIIARAGLTERQRAILFLRLDGFGFEEVGSRYGVTKQSAFSSFAGALVKLRRAARTYPHFGLAEVYAGELRRRRRA